MNTFTTLLTCLDALDIYYIKNPNAEIKNEVIIPAISLKANAEKAYTLPVSELWKDKETISLEDDTYIRVYTDENDKINIAIVVPDYTNVDYEKASLF